MRLDRLIPWVLAYAVFAAPALAESSCDAADAHPWLAKSSQRMTQLNLLIQDAMSRGATLESCSGTATEGEDGELSGELKLTFSDGLRFRFEAAPGTGVALHEMPGGFPDEAATLEVLRRYAQRMALQMDWENPEIGTEGEREVRTYRAPDSDSNAVAALLYADGALVAIRLSSSD
ncbi:hypothetical protein ABI59_21945 [Acidobacteria bacterium Mor1]|nr:hypothetical protein ABI59_21945 [Acidobacteria bacterium Mor1]